MIKYIGSKRLLVPKIVQIIKDEGAKKVLDLFSGTSRVGYALQNEGITVIANDHNDYAFKIAQTYVQADPKSEHIQTIIPKLIKEFNETTGEYGWFTKTYCEDSKFFHPKNGEKIDAIRKKIYSFNSSFCLEAPSEENAKIKEIGAILITSLIEAADRVDSTCGVQMAYLKKLPPRAYNDLELRIPEYSKGKGMAMRADAEFISGMNCDLVYIDPPYNQHSYAGNYHIWETLAIGDEPKTYGKAKKRVGTKMKKSNFNSKPKFKKTFDKLVSNVSANKILISFNNEGYLSYEDITSIIKKYYKNMEIFEIAHPRYVGSKIGIYNDKGQKVGKVSHTKNKEYLFLGKR